MTTTVQEWHVCFFKIKYIFYYVTIEQNLVMLELFAVPHTIFFKDRLVIFIADMFAFYCLRSDTNKDLLRLSDMHWVLIYYIEGTMGHRDKYNFRFQKYRKIY